jgi:hypothetical protein
MRIGVVKIPTRITVVKVLMRFIVVKVLMRFIMVKVPMRIIISFAGTAAVYVQTVVVMTATVTVCF